MKSIRTSLVAAVALCAVTITAGLALARVFADGSFALPVVLAAVIPHTIGYLSRRRRWSDGTTVLVTFAAILLYVAWIFAPHTTAYGAPLPGTLRHLADQLGDGWHIFRTGVAPVAADDGVVLLCVVITAIAATVSDGVAFRADATIGALVPSLLLFVFASMLGTDELRTVTTLAYIVAALVFLMLANQALLERRRAWATGRRLGSHAAVINVGALVGGIALLAGLVVGPALPGADDGPLLDYKSLGGARGAGNGPGDLRTLSPLVDIKARLRSTDNAQLFTVKAPLRLYWRVAALDNFDGRIWGIQSQAQEVSEVLDDNPPKGSVRQDFEIGQLGDQWLPAAFAAQSIDVSGARVIPESGTLIAPNRDISGLQYRVDSKVAPVTPSAAQQAATDAPTPQRLLRYEQLPASLPFGVGRLARRRITFGLGTPYARAQALEDFFLDGTFTYDLDVPAGSGTDAISEFLQTRRGFCEQFAGTYAAMARAVGLPARVAVGFAPGEYDPESKQFLVRARDAHAWPEVWLAGLGWTAFEPTPPGGQPGQAAADIGSRPTPAQTNTSNASTTTVSSAPTSGTQNSRPIPRGEGNVQAGGSSSLSGSGPDRGWVILLGLPLLALLGGAVWAASRVLRKARIRTRRRHSSTPAHSVSGAWQDALEHLAEAGMPPHRALTPREQTGSYRDRGAPDDALDALGHLADIYTVTTWSTREPDGEDVEFAWSAADVVRDSLTEGTRVRERARRALRSPETVR